MSNLKKIVLSLCSTFWLGCEEPSSGYIYPVDTIYHEGILKMCVLYQKKNGLELFFWDPTTHKATLGLLSFFQPTSLTVLPNREAFSFIDNDRIKVKYLTKRSPKSIDLYGPYNLTTIHWIDNENFYFCAQERRHYNLFHATIHGDLLRLTVSNTDNYLYPQKVENILYFIEESATGESSIKSVEYPIEGIAHKINKYQQVSLEEEVHYLMTEENNREIYTPLLDIKSASTLIEFGPEELRETSLAFLYMKNHTEGFFVSYVNHIEPKQVSLSLKYYKLYKTQHEWHTQFLFDFSIPLYLVMPTKNEITMNESILPFLPFHDESHIYFTLYNENTHNLELYDYDDQQGTTKKNIISPVGHEFFFSPRRYNGKIICGGNLIGNRKPIIHLKDNGYQYFEMPSISN